MAHYLGGVGQRAIERLVGVSHNSVMNRVLKVVEGRMLAPVAPEEVRVAEADELGTYVGEKRGLLAVVGW
jgi:hypothetical protein